MGVKTALGGPYSPCVPMWRDTEEDRTMDVTLGYDLNTCLLQLSGDQSSLRQAPLPAGNFSMHVTPSLTFSLLFLIFYLSLSLSLSLFFFFLLIFSLSPGLPPASPPSIHCRAPVQCVTHLLCLAMLPSLYLPLCAFSLHLTRPSCSFYLPRCRLAWGYHEKKSGAWGKGQMETNERHKAEDCRHTHNTTPAAGCASIQTFYTLFSCNWLLLLSFLSWF